jgi:hypothetical protein
MQPLEHNKKQKNEQKFIKCRHCYFYSECEGKLKGIHDTYCKRFKASVEARGKFKKKD